MKVYLAMYCDSDMLASYVLSAHKSQAGAMEFLERIVNMKLVVSRKEERLICLSPEEKNVSLPQKVFISIVDLAD